MGDEEVMKEIKKHMEKFYEKDGSLTEEGKTIVRCEYSKASEFEIELITVCNKYVSEMNPVLFGFVWRKVEEGIKIAHALNMMPPTTKPSNMFG